MWKMAIELTTVVLACCQCSQVAAAHIEKAASPGAVSVHVSEHRPASA